MNPYEMIARRPLIEEADELATPEPRAPFRMFVDDEARKAVLERATTVHQPTRGHRNPIKAVPAEMDA